MSVQSTFLYTASNRDLKVKEGFGWCNKMCLVIRLVVDILLKVFFTITTTKVYLPLYAIMSGIPMIK